MSQIIQPFNAEILKKASKLLSEGKLVCFPTETVYALSADATNDEAVEHIYTAKGRDHQKPLSLLVKSATQITTLCHMDNRAHALLEAFSPGPLTLVLRLKSEHHLSPLINPGMATIGVRIPDHPIAQAVLHEVPFPLIGTSANLSGKEATVTHEQVDHDLGKDVALIIQNQATTASGVASTIVDLSGDDVTFLRIGNITKQQILDALHLSRK